jgi:signal transduction histidine kinase
VKNNTELYGGMVAVDSELGKGTQFTVTLPARSLMRLRT